MADSLSGAEFTREIDEIEQSVRHVVQHMPEHGDYLKRYCPAPA